MPQSHLARAYLLEHQVFPLSRPELAHQLRKNQNDELANLLESVNDDHPLNQKQIEKTLARLETLTITA